MGLFAHSSAWKSSEAKLLMVNEQLTLLEWRSFLSCCRPQRFHLALRSGGYFRKYFLIGKRVTSPSCQSTTSFSSMMLLYGMCSICLGVEPLQSFENAFQEARL
eukprot:3301726-Amphidinium_carterae.3